jgi:hypothetical protein
MKPQKGGGFEAANPERDAASKGPLFIEPLAPRDRTTRRIGLPIFFGAIAVIAMLAILTRFGAYFAGASAAPTTPAPIAWISAVVTPSDLATPAPSGPQASEVRVVSLDAAIPDRGYVFHVGVAGHFTLTLSNQTGAPVSLTPCPTYRIFLVPDDGSAPDRLLNCAGIVAAAGSRLDDGEQITLDMAYTPATTDPVGNQQLEWVWQTPAGYQALALVGVYIAP